MTLVNLIGLVIKHKLDSWSSTIIKTPLTCKFFLSNICIYSKAMFIRFKELCDFEWRNRIFQISVPVFASSICGILKTAAHTWLPSVFTQESIYTSFYRYSMSDCDSNKCHLSLFVFEYINLPFCFLSFDSLYCNESL